LLHRLCPTPWQSRLCICERPGDTSSTLPWHTPRVTNPPGEGTGTMRYTTPSVMGRPAKPSRRTGVGFPGSGPVPSCGDKAFVRLWSWGEPTRARSLERWRSPLVRSSTPGGLLTLPARPQPTNQHLTLFQGGKAWILWLTHDVGAPFSNRSANFAAGTRQNSWWVGPVMWLVGWGGGFLGKPLAILTLPLVVGLALFSAGNVLPAARAARLT
jgi:hypothetical protein